MSADQILDYIGIICLIIVAIATGIDAALSFYIKRAAELKKPVPQQVMTIDEIAKFVVSEAATLDASGAEKKVQAVKALIDQANAEGKKVTEPVARGAVQHAYDQRQANASVEPADTEQPAQIGFLDSGDDSNGSSQA